jgi:hypothetical protein
LGDADLEVSTEAVAGHLLQIDLPMQHCGAEFGQTSHSGIVWWPQRDETPSGIPAEFEIDF